MFFCASAAALPGGEGWETDAAPAGAGRDGGQRAGHDRQPAGESGAAGSSELRTLDEAPPSSLVMAHGYHVSIPASEANHTPPSSAKGDSCDELRGHQRRHDLRGDVRAGSWSHPMVHCGRALLPGSSPRRHGCGWMLQLDRQLPGRNELPQTGGEHLERLNPVL